MRSEVPYNIADLKAKYVFSFLKGWNIDNSIQSLVLITAAISLYFLYKTLKSGQRQADESNELTLQNLSISQYQIYTEELKYFFEVFQSLKFKVEDHKFPDPDYLAQIKSADGIAYIQVFRILLTNSYFLKADSSLITERVDEFRHKIVFPLFRNYGMLYNFLSRVKSDQLLKNEHKKIIYLIVERDLLQHYFRLCNNEDPLRKKSYDLSLFDTPVFQSQSFCAINQFYVDNGVFSLHTLEFYKETL
jgi:hypothetical protein